MHPCRKKVLDNTFSDFDYIELDWSYSDFLVFQGYTLVIRYVRYWTYDTTGSEFVVENDGTWIFCT